MLFDAIGGVFICHTTINVVTSGTAIYKHTKD
jgi:hypothetical protein